MIFAQRDTQVKSQSSPEAQRLRNVEVASDHLRVALNHLAAVGVDVSPFAFVMDDLDVAIAEVGVAQGLIHLS
jgi:hypothetical protein